MEYIHRIRARVGSELVLIPATAVVLPNQRGEILFHERNESGEWGLPGGLMDTGETAEQCASREVNEETGLTVTDLRLFGIFSGPEYEVLYPNGDRTSPMVLGFYSENYRGMLRKTAESPQLGFFSPENLPGPMNRFHRLFLQGFTEFQQSGVVVLR